MAIPNVAACIRSRFILLLLCASSWPRLAALVEKASCRLKAGSETCPMTAMTGATQVFPGGRTRCISTFKPDYSFSVIPGDPTKLLLYFERGGACIDKMTTMMGACDENVEQHPLPSEGIFDRAQVENGYRDFTIVFVTYCSGDLFAAASTKPYGEQWGLVNTQAAVDWAKANVAAKLSSLVMMGASGGAIGVQIWAHTLLGSFVYERAAVVADSFITVIPAGAQHLIMTAYSICDNGLLSVANVAWCRAGNLTVQRIYATTIAEYPNVVFASINGKEDHAQIYYYNLVAGIFKSLPRKIEAVQFYSMANADLDVFSKNPNYVSFWVSGNVHCYLDTAAMYTVSATGLGLGTLTLADWLAELSARSSKQVTSQCAGTRLAQDQWSTTSTGYCDVSQAGKVLRIPTASTTSPPVFLSARPAVNALPIAAAAASSQQQEAPTKASRSAPAPATATATAPAPALAAAAPIATPPQGSPQPAAAPTASPPQQTLPPLAATTAPPPGRNMLAVLLGLSVFLVCAAAVVCCLLCFCCARRKSRGIEEDDSEDNSLE